MSRVLSALLSIGKNAVPMAGVLARDWAPPSAILLYLGENVVLVLLSALTVRLLVPGSGNALKTFFLVAVPFTFGAAVFTFAVILIRTEYTVDARQLLSGLGIMAFVQVIAFFRDLRRLQGLTLPDAENLLVSVLGRVFLLALAVWVGLFVAFFFSSAFVVPFIVLKTIVDVGSVWKKRPASSV